MKSMIVNDTIIFIRPGFYKILKKGSIVELRNKISDINKEWIEVISERCIIGYISEDTQLINLDLFLYVNQNFVIVYEQPELNSKIVCQYSRYEKVYLTDKVIINNKLWYQIYDIQGNLGYIEADTCLLSPNIDKKYIIYDNSIGVYKEPRLNSPIICMLNCGQIIKISKLIKDSDNNTWYQIDSSIGIFFIKANANVEVYEKHVSKILSNRNYIKSYSLLKLFFLTHGSKLRHFALIVVGVLLLSLDIPFIFSIIFLVYGIFGLICNIFDIADLNLEGHPNEWTDTYNSD